MDENQQQGDELKIEVMQLSSPAFSKSTKIPATKKSNPALHALNKSSEKESKLLILPSKLVASHLGEPFRICCAIRRKPDLSETHKILDLEVEVSMKKSQTQHKSTFYKPKEPVCLKDPQDSTDFV